jgi:hypothetical protein
LVPQFRRRLSKNAPTLPAPEAGQGCGENDNVAISRPAAGKRLTARWSQTKSAAPDYGQSGWRRPQGGQRPLGRDLAQDQRPVRPHHRRVAFMVLATPRP